MRKTLFALAVMVMGAFAFAAGTPAQAMEAGPLASITGVAKATQADTVEKVDWRHRRFCWRHPYHWSCRHHRRHHRCWWHHGHRRCNW